MNLRILAGTGLSLCIGLAPAFGAGERVLEKNERHVVTARYEGDNVVFLLEAIGDTTDNRSGTFPNVDFASFKVDVNQNGRIDENIDVSYGTSQRGICTQYLLSESSSSGCGAFQSDASLRVRFEATAASSTPHPLWEFSVPWAELTQSRERDKAFSHLVFTFYEAGKGYTRYPKTEKANIAFSKVITASLAPPLLVAAQLSQPLIQRSTVLQRQTASPPITATRFRTAATERVLEKNERHVVTARYSGNNVVFVLEAVGDTTDNRGGTFPNADFASIRVDVNQNGRIDENLDVSYATSRGKICTNYLISESSSTGCGVFKSRASLDVQFKGTSASRTPHPVWSFTIPWNELTRARSRVEAFSHLVFRFHEAGRGYTRYPATRRANVTFSEVVTASLEPPSSATTKPADRVTPGDDRTRGRTATLVRNRRHVITARRGSTSTTFVMEAVGDTTNDRGRYPNVDFATIQVDVNQNGVVDEGVDVAYGVYGENSDQLCSQIRFSETSSSGCGGLASKATLKAGFASSAISSTRHGIWQFTIPNRELTKDGVSTHLVFRFHEAGDGYTRYPAAESPSESYSTVLAIDLKTMTASTHPQPEAEDQIAPAPPEEEEDDQVAVKTNDSLPPNVSIIRPVADAGGRISVDSKNAVVEGSADDESGIYEVLINGVDANVSADGRFWSEVKLAFGENRIQIRVTDTMENWTEETLIVVREQGEAPPSDEQGGDDSRGVGPANETVPAELSAGAYRALLIAVEDYEDPAVNDLDHPLSDARKLERVLVDRYLFEQENVTVLENPDEDAIFQAFADLGRVSQQDDNVIIFFAGHGIWNEQISQGYWLPADATKTSAAAWISNGAIRDFINGIQSKHTLLISDACFSGGLFKTRSAFSGADRAVQELYRLPSRKAMTSGTLTEVPDQSVFLEYLTQRLQDNQGQWVSADALFADFRLAVINNSPNTPQYGVIHQAGDEGGEFIFVRRPE